jgi:hypothetical protein
MPRPLRRRPSVPTLIALLALFVALGGPAEAQRLINGKDIKRGTVRGPQIKDRSLGTRELSRRAFRALRQTPNASVTASKLASAAVTPAKIAPNAVHGGSVLDMSLGAADLAPDSVGSEKIPENAIGQSEVRTNGVAASEIADNSIDGGEVIDGGLDAADATKFAGSVQIDFGMIAGGSCVTRPAPGLPSDAADVNISDDLVVASAAGGWPSGRLYYGVEAGPTADVFSISACNPSPTDDWTPPGPITFRYGVFDL